MVASIAFFLICFLISGANCQEFSDSFFFIESNPTNSTNSNSTNWTETEILEEKFLDKIKIPSRNNLTSVNATKKPVNATLKTPNKTMSENKIKEKTIENKKEKEEDSDEAGSYDDDEDSDDDSDDDSSVDESSKKITAAKPKNSMNISFLDSGKSINDALNYIESSEDSTNYDI